MQTTEILRTEVKFRFIDYLKAAQIPYYEPALTVCPHCGQHAQVMGDFLWNCPNCGSKGDVVDYAMESHGFRKSADALKPLKVSMVPSRPQCVGFGQVFLWIICM